MQEKEKRGRGRPPTYTMPDRIDASPEEIAKAVLSIPKKDRWRYMEQEERKRTKDS